MKSSAIVVFLFVTALLAGTAAQAVVIFDNFGPGDDYSTTPTGQALYITDFGVSSLLNQDIAAQFGPVATTYYLTSVDLPLSYINGPSDTAYIYLMSGWPEPTAIVDATTYFGVPIKTGVVQPLISVPFDFFELIPGETYWIVVSCVDVHNSEVLWGTNSIGMTGGYGAYISVDFVGEWTMYNNATYAMRVNAETEAVKNEGASWGALKVLFR